MTISLEELQTPALLVDLEVTRHNIARTVEIAGGAERWRPHVKTSKIPEVMQLVFDAGVRQFKCATTKEARCLFELATESIDLLVAMPLYGANLQKIAELRQANSQHQVSVITEDPNHARSVREIDAELGLFLDLNPGYNRTGTPLADRNRISATIEAAGSALRGLHYYDGHLVSGSRADRQTDCAEIYAELTAFADQLNNPNLELITSGTPTFPIAAAYPGFKNRKHRISPGTVVYWDGNSENLEIEGYEAAVHVLSRVISRPNGERITCDAGSKAIDAAAGDPCCRVVNFDGLTAQRPSEEHLPLHIDKGTPPAPGSLIRLFPKHVCPTVNLADTAVLIENGEIQKLVPVSARGHDT